MSCPNCGLDYGCSCYPQLAAARTAMAGEPVAWVVFDKDTGLPLDRQNVYAVEPSQWVKDHNVLRGYEWRPVYAAPQPASPPLQATDEGDGEPCAFCGYPCDNLAANPGKWSLCFAHPDGTGIAKFHHVDCVTGRLFPEPQPPDRVIDDKQEKKP